MKRKFFLLSLAVSVLFAARLPAQELSKNRKTGDLKVVVTGAKANRGTIRIALVNSIEGYKKRKAKKHAFRVAKPQVQDYQAAYVFEGVPYGEYAIKLYHDENGNGKLDTNFLKIPTEAYGFSNNARGKLGLPSYEKAKFRVEAPFTLQEINLP